MSARQSIESEYSEFMNGRYGQAANGHDKAAPAPDAQPLFRQAWELVDLKRENRWLLHKVLEESVLAVIAGPRGTFKSFVALDWLMRIAVDGKTVAILSGEGAGLDRRIDAWMRTHAPDVDLRSLSILVLERPMNLSLAVEMAKLTEAIGVLPERPVVVMVDTFSKFSAGLDENDNGQVAEYLAALSECIRDEFECTVLLVAHSGHGDGRRPRGASALMANPDAEYMVERASPTDMTVTVSRERFKDGPAMPPVAYEARVVDLGRDDSYGERVTSLALHSTEVPTVKFKAAGKNQEKAIGALKEWARANAGATHITSIDLTAIYKTQELNDRRRRREVTDSLVNNRILSPATGGHTFHRENL